jgi:nucleotide-binding universal stress UspA family protein
MGTIVVGIDGSKGARRALEWALTEARRRGDALRVLHALRSAQVPEDLGRPLDAAAAGERLALAERVIDEALHAVGDPADLAIDRVPIVDRDAAQSLVEASRDADLLVVGSRGLGGFYGLMMGSVSQQCVTHAHCPTVVVPGER